MYFAASGPESLFIGTTFKGMAMKVCSQCQINKNESEYYKYNNTLKSYCKECDKKYGRIYRQRHKNIIQTYKKQNRLKYKDQERNQRYLKFYNITINDYNNILEKQNGVCYICKENTKKLLAVDHCHKTNKIRGLLCDKCNRGIGFFKDNIELLKTAITYLEGK